MKFVKSSVSCLALLVLLFASCKDEEEPQTTATAEISGLNGNTVSGSANFVVAGDEVEMVLTLQGLTPGKHGVHLHTGTCGDDGSTIRTHWNPTAENHGQRGGASFHRGDVGNIEADENGSGTLTISAEDWTMSGAPMENIIGLLVVVHAGEDDYVSQPSGESGEMIGCGMIQ